MGPILVLACADGAGSGMHAAIGAQLACRAITRLASEELGDGIAIQDITEATVVRWHRKMRTELEMEASRRQANLRDLACTLLLAVVGPRGAVFSQVGDGAIIILDGDAYHTVFWPQSGEYCNTTNFVTDSGFERNVAFRSISAGVDELALLTDGLQRLALNVVEETVHVPFFRPMFQQLREAGPGAGLAKALQDYLDSPRVNRRTDDDKTLILATRVPSCVCPAHTL